MIWRAAANSGSETGDPHFVDLWFADAPFSCRTLIAEWIQRGKKSRLNTSSAMPEILDHACDIDQSENSTTNRSIREPETEIQRNGVHIPIRGTYQI